MSDTSHLIPAVVVRAMSTPEVDYDDGNELWRDLTQAVAGGCPFDFARLAVIENHHFIHDINGLKQHLDRKTGRVTLWRPRCNG